MKRILPEVLHRKEICI